jgi:hemerythrin-like domain-containing protein
MEHATLIIIRREHRVLSAMLRSLGLLLERHRRRGTLPDFATLRAMLFYVDEFPERLHHPKESGLLFPKLRGHGAELDDVLDRLDHEHAQGEHAIRELEHALLGFEMMCGTDEGDHRRQAFERSAATYVDFYLDHMKTEETHVFPLAEIVLGTRDWAELDAAFMTNLDPLADPGGRTPAYRPVFMKVLDSFSPLSGIGGALEALAGFGPPKFNAFTNRGS